MPQRDTVSDSHVTRGRLILLEVLTSTTSARAAGSGSSVSGLQDVQTPALRLLIRWEGAAATRCWCSSIRTGRHPDQPREAGGIQRVGDCPVVADGLVGRRLADLAKAPDDRRVVLAFGDAGRSPRLIAEVRPILRPSICATPGAAASSGTRWGRCAPVSVEENNHRDPGSRRLPRSRPDPSTARRHRGRRSADAARSGAAAQPIAFWTRRWPARAPMIPTLWRTAVAAVVAEAYAPSAGAVLYVRPLAAR